MKCPLSTCHVLIHVESSGHSTLAIMLVRLVWSDWCCGGEGEEEDTGVPWWCRVVCRVWSSVVVRG